MFGYFFQVQVNAQSGAIRYFDIAIHDLYRIRHNLGFPGIIEFVEDFVDQEIGYGSI